MSEPQAAPQTRGAAVNLLATVDLGSEIEVKEAHKLRMRMVTIEVGSPRTTDQVWAGQRTGTPSTGSRAGGAIPAVEISGDVIRHE